MTPTQPKTAEEILRKYLRQDEDYTESNVIKAMYEFKDQFCRVPTDAVEFAEWMLKNTAPFNESHRFFANQKNITLDKISIKELYELFKNRK